MCLTRSSSCTLPFSFKASAMAFKPSSWTRMQPCTAHVIHHTIQQHNNATQEQTLAKSRVQKQISPSAALSRFCSLSEQKQLLSRPRRQHRCCPAPKELTLVTVKKVQLTVSPMKQKTNLTKSSLSTLLISPVFIRAANITKSAHVAPEHSVSISLQSTSNSVLPNFTLAIEFVSVVRCVREKVL